MSTGLRMNGGFSGENLRLTSSNPNLHLFSMKFAVPHPSCSVRSLRRRDCRGSDSCRAASVLNLDPMALTVTFSGTDMGTPIHSGNRAGRSGPAAFQLVEYFEQQLSLNDAVGRSSGRSRRDEIPSFTYQGSVSDPGFEIAIASFTFAEQTITGTGIAATYAKLRCTATS